LHTISFQFCYMFARSDIYFRLYLLLIIITTTCISLSLRQTSAPIHLISVLGVLGTQETFCIVTSGMPVRCYGLLFFFSLYRCLSLLNIFSLIYLCVCCSFFWRIDNIFFVPHMIYKNANHMLNIKLYVILSNLHRIITIIFYAHFICFFNLFFCKFLFSPKID
jgi:hypothetical protein